MNTFRMFSRQMWVRGVVVLALLLSAMSASAAVPTARLEGPAGPQGTHDDAPWDLGAEYVSDWPPAGASGGDLPMCSTSAWNFRNRLRAFGYTGADSFIWGNQNAWITDWKSAASGGNEEEWVDDVDIAYYCDHGSSGSVAFGWGPGDTTLTPNECWRSYGTKDNEWMAFGTCLTLTNHLGWANCMYGQHLILGYITVSYDADEGGVWANQLLAGQTVMQGWFNMCDITQPSSVKARVIAEDWRCAYDKIWGKGGPYCSDYWDMYYYVYDHSCYKAEPTKIDTSILAEVLTYKVDQRNVDAGYVQNLAGVLGMEGAAQLSPDGQQWTLTNTSPGMSLTLTIDTASGGYNFQNLAALWTPPNPEQPTPLPSPTEATTLANGYILGHQALPGTLNINQDKIYAATESQETWGKSSTAQTSAVLAAAGMDVMVSYERKPLATGAISASGVAQTGSVTGPGSATKFYYGGTSAAAAGNPAAQQLPAGLLGGSRDVTSGPAVAVTGAGKAWDNFLANHGLAIVNVPLDADEIVLDPLDPVANASFSYYEQPKGISQKELIPTYVFTADFKKGGEIIANNTLVYMPASTDYYPPVVQIDAPLANGTIVAGTQISLNSTASGTFAPFTFQWSSSTQGALAATEDAKVMLMAPEKAGGEPTQTTIVLKVTNANGQFTTQQVTVDVIGKPVWLPLITRN